MKKIKYYIFAITWHWKNRKWKNTRQKQKAFEKAILNQNKRS